jgi:hypothetical protein
MRDSLRLRADDYETFWGEYPAELGPEASRRRQKALGPWEGIESGLPLWWHLDAPREVGFQGGGLFLAARLRRGFWRDSQARGMTRPNGGCP